jgi:GntR family transcriptional repressor for pyruvate dehydrogenase complex
MATKISENRSDIEAPPHFRKWYNQYMPESIPNNRIRKDDVTAGLIRRFKDMIAARVLVPGCKLPPERELASRFGVSRSSLRQALKVLEIMGVLSQRVGDGTYLNSSAAAILGEPLDFLVLLDDISHHELFEARLIVEPELAARAAERATVEDLAALRRELKALETGRSESNIIEADLGFHAAIFRASGNRVCQAIFSVVQRALIASMRYNSRRDDVRRTLAFHTPIYEAISRRDAAAARRRMIEHLSEAKALLNPARANGRTNAIGEHLRPLRSSAR